MPDGHGPLMETVVDDPDQTYKKIHQLDPNTTYTMTIVALTDAGRGPEVTVKAFTVPVSGAYVSVRVCLCMSVSQSEVTAGVFAIPVSGIYVSVTLCLERSKVNGHLYLLGPVSGSFS